MAWFSFCFFAQFVAVFCLRQTMQKTTARRTKAVKGKKAARRKKAATAAPASEMLRYFNGHLVDCQSAFIYHFWYIRSQGEPGGILGVQDSKAERESRQS